MSPFSSKSVWRKNSQNNGYFWSWRRRSRSDAIEASRASRSDAIEDREAMLSKHREAIEASRSDAPGASQMMTRRGLKGEAPPARDFEGT